MLIVPKGTYFIYLIKIKNKKDKISRCLTFSYTLQLSHILYMYTKLPL